MDHQYSVLDLYVERDGEEITQITKSGVVIWPQEGHTAPMQKDSPNTPPKPNEYMIGGNHYKSSGATGKCPHCKGPVEHWDWAHNLRALEYAATKYLARWREKGGLDSLKKVIHYVQKLIEIHFPDVVVSINYSNRMDGIERSEDLQELGRGEATGSAKMAQQQAIYQTALDTPLENADYTAKAWSQCPWHHFGTRCTKGEGHTGPHDLG